MPSEPSHRAQPAADASVRLPPLIEVTDTNGRSRSPLLVLTISPATRARSSCGINATSRTLPQRLPAVSNTGVPSSSLFAKVGRPPRILNCRARIHRTLELCGGGHSCPPLSKLIVEDRLGMP